MCNVCVFSMFPINSKGRNTSILTSFLLKELEYRGYQPDLIISSDIKSGCTGCGKCSDSFKCVFEDKVSNLSGKFICFIVTPVYFFGLPSQTKAFLDRLYSKDMSKITFAPIYITGSQFYNGGVDLLIEQFDRIDRYCGSTTLFPYNKVTYDTVLPLSTQDILGIQDLIDRVEEVVSNEN